MTIDNLFFRLDTYRESNSIVDFFNESKHEKEGIARVSILNLYCNCDNKFRVPPTSYRTGSLKKSTDERHVLVAFYSDHNFIFLLMFCDGDFFRFIIGVTIYFDREYS